MSRRPTRADVAELAGVSKTTVTFVLANRMDIAIPETTRQRVRDAVQQLGYRPNAIAQALVSGKTQAISVAFPNLIVPHYARVLQVLERLINAQGYHMIATTIGHVKLGNVLPDLWAIMNSPNDGVILVDMPESYKPYIDEMMPFTKPIVSMGIHPYLNTDRIEIDLAHGAIAAVNHLLEQNPKRFAFFGLGIPNEAAAIIETAMQHQGDPRAIAYCQLLSNANRPLEIIVGSYEGRRANMDILKAYVSENNCPDAIFCFDDEMAISAHRALREMGLRLPQDVLLVGCDGNEDCEYLEPMLSTIAQPVDAMCRLAWEFMQTRLADSNVPVQHARLAAELIVRESSHR